MKTSALQIESVKIQNVCEKVVERLPFLYKRKSPARLVVQRSLLALRPRIKRNPLITVDMRSANCITIKSKDFK